MRFKEREKSIGQLHNLKFK